MNVKEECRHIYGAVVYSFRGLKTALYQECAFRQEMIVLLLVIPFGIWIGKTGVEKALLVGSWLLVMVIELLNSAIETIVNRVGLEPNRLSGIAKDLGSAAVCLAIFISIMVWAFILFQ
jgi:diacylglycerol kinase (ATP)